MSDQPEPNQPSRSDVDLLISMIGHDLRGPLNVMTLVGDILERSDSAPPELLARLRRSTGKIDRRILELTEFARARLGGGIRVTPRPVDARGLLDSVASKIAGIYPDRDRVPTSAESRMISVDPDRVERAVVWLVCSSVDRGGDPAITARPVPGGFEIEVRDGGIPLDSVEALREPDRTCLGVFLAAEIARAHGGEATGQSSGDGTVVVLRFPD